ncbi:MAG: hypothetical protein ACRD36_01315 [Candidatus Acidiferrum sp.]
MSDFAKQFIELWIAENVRATGCDTGTDASMAKKLAAECWAAADSASISRLEIKTSCGDLVERMEDAIEAANRAEVNRFALKGDCSTFFRPVRCRAL